MKKNQISSGIFLTNLRKSLARKLYFKNSVMLSYGTPTQFKNTIQEMMHSFLQSTTRSTKIDNMKVNGELLTELCLTFKTGQPNFMMMSKLAQSLYLISMIRRLESLRKELRLLLQMMVL